MYTKTAQWLRVWLSTIVIISLVLIPATADGAEAKPVGQQTPTGDPPGNLSDLPSARAEAVRLGRWPAQTAASQGAIQPDLHGPQRNDPAEGIPTHAYSPFDERRNREYPCPPGGCDYETGHVLVKLAPGVNVAPLAQQESGQFTGDADLDAVLSGQGIVRIEPLFPTATPPQPNEQIVDPDGQALPRPDLTRWYVAAFENGGADVYATVEALAKAPGVAWAEPDYLRKPVGEPAAQGSLENSEELVGTAVDTQEQPLSPDFSDPLYGQQWHLPAVHAPEAWAYLQSQGLPPGGSSDIVVAVIDTGVDYTHPDLAANMWVNAPEFNGVTGVDDDGNGYVDDKYGADTVTPDGNPIDDHGHGTHVAGIIAAQADNGIGGVGVAYTSRIMALKAAQYSGVLAASDIAEAIYYAVQKGAQVINMSFGGYARSQVEEDALAVAFGQAVLVAAAGNDAKVNLPCVFGRDMYPAAYNWVLGVMASTSSGSRASFSNFDCIPHDTHEYELLAPGVDVWSTLPGSQYAAWDGTSMAAPVVSGIAVLARTKWSDSNLYTSRFIMGQIAANASPIADAQIALTVSPRPELSYLQHWLFDTDAQSPANDEDGIVDSGETIDLAIVIRNHWGKADPVNVTLEAWADGAYQPDPYVTMITGTVNYGAVGSFNQDDNGLVYDNEGAVIGVEYPFRFQVDQNTPNDHVIPFRLTISAGNGYDPADPNAPYSFESWFYVIVQRGRELPGVISEDLILSKDDFWLVSGPTLIESGVTVTATEGTQIQFWSIDPTDPYNQADFTYLQVEGTFRALGTFGDPVEMFPSSLYPGNPVDIQDANGGNSSIIYAKVLNPQIGGYWRRRTWAMEGQPINEISHSLFEQDLIRVLNIDHAEWNRDWTPPIVRAESISGTRFHRLRGYGATANGLSWGQQPSAIRNSLFDQAVIDSRFSSVQDSVFLPASGSKIVEVGFQCTDCDPVAGRANNQFKSNAILNSLWKPDTSGWVRVFAPANRNIFSYITDNYWATTSDVLIGAAIQDYFDDFNLGPFVYQPILIDPSATTFPFVVDVTLSTPNAPDTNIVGTEPVTFTVTLNRDIDTAVQPAVSFGPDVPVTDFTVHPINGGWVDARTWQGMFNVTPITGDGYQLLRVAGAVAADDPWLVTGDDAGRFRFEIITSGTSAMNLQATGGEGFVDLMWTQDDFDLLAGYNLYKSSSQNGPYTRVNPTLIPPAQHIFRDTAVQPGVPAYYKFTVVKSDMSESGFSNVAAATPIDTIPPAIGHTPVTEAPPGLSLSLFADVTDNVGVQSVTLFYRAMGATPYQSLAMLRTTGNRYSATIPGSAVAAPGIEYYVEASDGISTVRSGRPEYPHQVTVSDRPIVTSVTPNHGPTVGGTSVTIAGSNFKPGASVTFGGAVCGNVVVVSGNQLTCSTPPHYPSVVDVMVTNPGAQSGTLLNAFTFESDTASLSLPDTGGQQHALVQVPVNIADVEGMAAASLKVAFDPTVVQAVSASTGSLTPGWSLAANTNTPGEIRLSLASPGGTVSGSGTLAVVQFDVVGAPGQSSALTLHDVLLNDGAIPTETAAGSFEVEQVYSVAGTIGFWHGGVVSNTLLSLAGDRVYTGLSNAAGTYTVAGAAADDYVLTPSKSDEANGISAYDASLALQHDAGLNLLTGHAATAADTNRSGAINSMDAFHILQKSVDLIALPFPGAGAVWRFDPTNRSYTNLSSNLTGQNFTAILLGDASGNWAPDPPAAPERPTGSAVLSLEELLAAPGEQIEVTLSASLTDAQLYAADLAVTYDPDVLAFVSAAPGAGVTGFMTAVNASQPGHLSLALAGAAPSTAGGELFALSFEVVGSDGSSPLVFERAELNEGQISVQTEDGSLTVVQRSTFAIRPGWNLLALPLVPLSTLTAQSLLDAIDTDGGSCTEVNRWLNGGWDAHINNLPFNDFAIVPGKGYFLKCTATSAWTMPGHSLAAGVPIALQPGWNLVGVPHPASGYLAQALLDAITVQGGACSEVDRWLNGGWDAHIGGLPFNNFAVEPDQGYFLKCSQSSIFIPDAAIESIESVARSTSTAPSVSKPMDGKVTGARLVVGSTRNMAPKDAAVE